MSKGTWLIGLVLVSALGVILATSPVFARGTTYPTGTESNGSWENMPEQCHGAGGMMGSYGAYHMGLTDPVTLERVAGTLGLTYEQLTARLTQGETIAEVAQAQGVDSSLVVVTILAPYSEILQVRVNYGYLSVAQAQATLEQVRYWIEQVITAPQDGYYRPATSPTGGYTQRYAPNYGGRGWGGGQGGMMGGGMMGGGMMGNGGMMGGGGMMGNW